MDQFLTLKRANIGPVLTLQHILTLQQAYIYIYIYNACCEVIIWAKFGHFKGFLSGPSEGYYLGQVCF